MTLLKANFEEESKGVKGEGQKSVFIGVNKTYTRDSFASVPNSYHVLWKS